MQWREANRRRQRQAIRYRGLVPTPPSPWHGRQGTPRAEPPPPGTADQEGRGWGKWGLNPPPPPSPGVIPPLALSLSRLSSVRFLFLKPQIG